MITNVESIDIVKYIAAILVIGIHTITNAPINSMGIFLFINGIARLAVPFFFCCTGYFFGEKNIKDWTLVSKYIKKLFKIYIIWSLVYIPMELIQMAGTGTFDLNHLLKYLQIIIVEGTFFHLWYFPAVIFAVVALYFILRKLSKNYIIILIIILYVIGLLGDGYGGVIEFLPQWVGHSIGVYKSIFITTRNGLFFAVPFIYLGVLINKYEEKLKRLKSSLFFVVSVILICFEVYFLNINNLAYDYNMIIFIVPAVFFLFIMLIKCRINFNINSKKLRLYSMSLYGIHMFFYGILLAIMTVFNIGFLKIGMVQFLLVFALSQGYATIVNRVKSED